MQAGRGWHCRYFTLCLATCWILRPASKLFRGSCWCPQCCRPWYTARILKALKTGLSESRRGTSSVSSPPILLPLLQLDPKISGQTAAVALVLSELCEMMVRPLACVYKHKSLLGLTLIGWSNIVWVQHCAGGPSAH